MRKDFLKYVSFNIIGMIGLSFYILADTFFVANALGADGLTALNLSIPVYSFINATGLMLGIGGATRYMISKSRHSDTGRIYSDTILFGTIFGIAGVLIGVFFVIPLAGLLGADSVTLTMTASYLRVILLSSPFFLCNNILLAFVRNDGNPQLSMAAMITGSLVNIVLDYLFLFPLSMGISGAALATGFSPLISMGVLSIHFIRHKNGFHFRLHPFHLRQMLSIVPPGLSSFATELSSGIVLIVFNYQFLKYSGNTGVAAYGIVANISLVGIAVFTGIAQGIQPLTSKAMGTGNFHLQKKLKNSTILLATLCAVILYVLVNTGANGIITAFNKENSRELLFIAKEGFPIYFSGFLFAGINIVIAAFLSAAGAEAFGFLITILRGCIAILPLALLLPQFLGVHGIWLAFPLAEFTACLVTVYALRQWKRKPA